MNESLNAELGNEPDHSPMPAGSPPQGAPPLRIARTSGDVSLLLGNEVVTTNLERADTMASRMKGLLGRGGLAPSEGLWITPCSSIHMFFMRFPIDVIFVDRDLQVIRVHENVQPWKMARGGGRAHSAIELPAGRVAFYNIRAGDRLRVE